MNDRGPAIDPARVGTIVRVIHAAISAGLVIVFGVFLYLQALTVPGLAAGTARGLRIAAYALLVLAVLVSGLLRGRIAPRGRDVEPAQWWTANLPGAIAVWALSEAGGLGAMTLGWLIGDTTLLALGAAVGLALLFVNRPGRLQREL